jgi:VRR-NUC domain
VRIDQITPEIYRLMSPQDQAFYGGQPGIHLPYEDDPHPPNKTGTTERREQREFANWLLLHGYYDGTVWHRTDKATGAKRGCPDFIVPIWKGVLYIEFKLPGGKLSKEQEEFRACIEAKGHTLFVCYSAHEAMQLVEQNDRQTP